MIEKVIRRLLIFFVIFLCAGVLIFFTLPSILISSSQAPNADVIINFSIDSRSKADNYIARLYRAKVARKIVTVSSQISHDTYPADFARDHLVSLGVNRQDIYSLHLPILDCRAKVLEETTKYLKEQGWHSALMICHPEDSRALSWQGQRILGREGIEIAVGYAPEDLNELTDEWWYTHWKVQRFVDKAMNTSLDLFYAQCR